MSGYCHKCQTSVSELKCKSKTHLYTADVYCCKCWRQYQKENGRHGTDCENISTNTQNSKGIAKEEQAHCPICFEERLEHALVECGHIVCGDCKPKLKNCPICRAAIRGTIRVYVSK